MHIFSTPPLLDDGQQTDYAGQLEILHDDDFVDEASNQIREAGFYRKHSPFDQRASICYAEAERRGKVWLYQRAYNKAKKAEGLTLHPSDLAMAQEPVAKAA